MMRPDRWRFMAGITAWHISIVPLRLMSRLASQRSSLIFSTRSPPATPALLTRMSMRPNSRSTAAAAAWQSAAWRTSTRSWRPGQSRSSHSDVTASSRSWRTSLTTTVTPSSASVVAMTRPMTRPPPRTKTSLPLRSISMSHHRADQGFAREMGVKNLDDQRTHLVAGLVRGAALMGREDDVVECEQRLGNVGLFGEHIECGAGEPAALQHLDQRRFVDQRTTGHVDEIAFGAKGFEHLTAHDSFRASAARRDHHQPVGV